MTSLFELTARGSVAFLLVAALNRLFAARTSARSRRAWQWVVPIAFLWALPGLPLPSTAVQRAAAGWNQFAAQATAQGTTAFSAPATTSLATPPSFSVTFLSVALTGSGVYLLIIAARTRSALRQWSRAPLCLDPALLGILEECKRTAGIFAPIGLVVTDKISAPVILGWLRPRILLPEMLATSASREQMQAILFHELAHFRAFDIPFNWLFTLVCALHWFNPAAHLAFRAWARFCEEAADETAIRWMKQPSGQRYGETLLHVLRNANGQTAPYAALAIVESVRHLKSRLTMIKQYEHKSPRLVLTGIILTLLATAVLLRPARAAESGADEPKAVAAGVMRTWLHEIDDAKYDQSWSDASSQFQAAVSSPGWVAALKQVRAPLGKCTARTLASASRQTSLPSPTGALQGNFILAQFDSSFDGLKYAVETVTFSKAPDGSWKASGYYIKPRP